MTQVPTTWSAPVIITYYSLLGLCVLPATTLVLEYYYGSSLSRVEYRVEVLSTDRFAKKKRRDKHQKTPSVARIGPLLCTRRSIHRRLATSIRRTRSPHDTTTTVVPVVEVLLNRLREPTSLMLYKNVFGPMPPTFGGGEQIHPTDFTDINDQITVNSFVPPRRHIRNPKGKPKHHPLNLKKKNPLLKRIPNLLPKSILIKNKKKKKNQSCRNMSGLRI